MYYEMLATTMCRKKTGQPKTNPAILFFALSIHGKEILTERMEK
jgi:hypothetical protein